MSRQTRDENLSGWRISDARGRKVTQLDPVSMAVLHQHSVIDRETLHSIASGPGLKISLQERVSLAVGVVALLLVISLFLYAIFIKQDFTSAPYARSSSLLLFIILPWVAWVVITRARFGNVAAAMLRHHRCPHCGYDLRLLPADSADGATVCPECGCAWKLVVGEGSPTNEVPP